MRRLRPDAAGVVRRGDSRAPRSAPHSTSTEQEVGPNDAASVSVRTSSRAAARRCCWSGRRRVTAVRASPASPSHRSASSPGTGPTEATSTIVHRVLTELDLEEEVLLWNAVPAHPHRPGDPATNRPPTRDEVSAGRPFLATLARGRRVIAVGRVAGGALGIPWIRHPSHGGASDFANGLLECAVGGRLVRRFAAGTPVVIPLGAGGRDENRGGCWANPYEDLERKTG